mmetsp:Transcript_27385/g.30629  ORF Transcript_27385/g.30629 Transcript_27385/m.30629 type:complete len:833 (-) Transcript_27385:382-2880(-)
MIKLLSTNLSLILNFIFLTYYNSSSFGYDCKGIAYHQRITNGYSIIISSSLSLSPSIIPIRGKQVKNYRMIQRTSFLLTSPIDDDEEEPFPNEESSERKDKNGVWKKFFKRNKTPVDKEGNIKQDGDGGEEKKDMDDDRGEDAINSSKQKLKSDEGNITATTTTTSTTLKNDDDIQLENNLNIENSKKDKTSMLQNASNLIQQLTPLDDLGDDPQNFIEDPDRRSEDEPYDMIREDEMKKTKPGDETKITNLSVNDVKPSRRRSWIFGRRIGNNEDGINITENNSIQTTMSSKKAKNITNKKRKTSAASKKATNNKGGERDGDDEIDKPPKKKKKNALGKVYRALALIVAIMLYPMISDELGDQIIVRTSSAPHLRSSEDVEPEIKVDLMTPITTIEIDDSDKPTVLQKSEDLKEKKDDESWKDEIPPVSKRRNFIVPSVPNNNGKNNSNNNKNGLNSLNNKRRMALTFISDVVDQVGPSVVRIDTENHPTKEPSTRGDNTYHPPGSYVQQGQGSGLIFSSEGFILTNAHVVEDATKVKVTLTDGRVYSCEVTGTDDIVDIAVLKIIPDDGPPISNLPVAELGDSDQLKVGKIVVAVGSPGGLDNTVTMGIVSGRERSSMMVGVPHKLVNYIQTDAAINPGNSGGPLIDVESGQVIGINAAIRAHMEGTSFAIPINRVRDIMNDLSEGKEVRHGYLGCQLTTCTPDWARENNADTSSKSADKIPEVYGALVHKIYRKTSSHLGGLKEHDIIQRIGSETVRSASDASRLIDLATPGDNIPFTVLRNGNVKIINVKPKDMSSTQKEIQREQQRRLQEEKNQFQELGPFRSLLRD